MRSSQCALAQILALESPAGSSLQHFYASIRGRGSDHTYSPQLPDIIHCHPSYLTFKRFMSRLAKIEPDRIVLFSSLSNQVKKSRGQRTVLKPQLCAARARSQEEFWWRSFILSVLCVHPRKRPGKSPAFRMTW